MIMIPLRLTVTITIAVLGALPFVACVSSNGGGDGVSDPTNPNPNPSTSAPPSSSEDERGSVGVPPTAAGYCVMLNYTLTANSECQFPDGTSCEEWAFYRGECGQAHSYCNQHGGTISNRTEDAGTFTATYGICDLNGKQCQEGNFIANGKCE